MHVHVPVGDNGELPEVNTWLTKLEERKLEHYDMEQQVASACGVAMRQSRRREALKRKAEVVAHDEGRCCKLGEAGGANQQFSSGGMEGVSIGLHDLEAGEQVVISIVANAMSQCAHTTKDSMDACSPCSTNKRKALGDWCALHKSKARRILQGKMNKRAAEHSAGDSGSSKRLRLQWGAVPAME